MLQPDVYLLNAAPWCWVELQLVELNWVRPLARLRGAGLSQKHLFSQSTRDDDWCLEVGHHQSDASILFFEMKISLPRIPI